ncbi:MAG: divalent-cation tolerance protein CutA [Deltaproteobacteria bacterium]|nr:divalent-cation tolerance protein CutA [Deltaproteobacteria bacterium]
MSSYVQVIISATSKREAERIATALVRKRLVAGTLIVKGDSRYWWNKKIVRKTYWNIQAFSLRRFKTKIIASVKKLHSDECPIIAFTKIDGNREFLKWVKESVK